MLNIKEYFINAGMLITIIYLAGLLNKQFFVNLDSRPKEIILIILAVFTGWCSMFFGIHLSHSVIFDLRFIPIIIVSLYAKNPWYVLITGIGIGLMRLTFGINEAAYVGLINVVVMAIAGVFLLKLTEKMVFYKRIMIHTLVLNMINTIVIAVLGVIPVSTFLKLITPIAFPMNIILSLFIVWMIKDLYEEYLYKMELINKANIDPLTQLYNRRAFKSQLKRFTSGKVEMDILTIAFIDLDLFKKINDTHGHIVGDVVLQKVSALIKDSLRSIDIIARYGGEEFVVMLPNCNKNDALIAMERIRKTAEAKPLQVNGIEIPVTLSIGVATSLPGAAVSLVAAADKAMYHAKNNGRNRVESARESITASLSV